MWDWSEGLNSQECFGALFCCPANLHLSQGASVSRTVTALPVQSIESVEAWIPSLSPLQASQIASCQLQLNCDGGAALEEDQASRIREAMGSARLGLEAMVVAGVRFVGPYFLAGGAMNDPENRHGKLTILPPLIHASRQEDISDSEGRMLMVSRIYETMSSRLNGRPRTQVVQRALKSALESLTVSDPFARLYLVTSAIQHLLDLREPEARLHVSKRLESIALDDPSSQPSFTEVLLRSFSIRDDYQRAKADARPIPQRQAAAMEQWMPRLIPFLESFAFQLLRRLLLRPALTETLGCEDSCAEFWLLPLSRRESLWGEPLSLASTAERPASLAVVSENPLHGPRNASTIARAA